MTLQRDTSTIVVFRTCGLGDFILSMPAFLMLRERFPVARIVLATMASTDGNVAARLAAYAGGATAAPWIGLLRAGVLDEVVTLPGLQSVRALAVAARRLRRMRPKLVVQMMDVGIPWRRRLKKMAFAMLLIGPVRQVGWRQPGSVERGRVPTFDPGLSHHVHGPLQFMRELFGADAYNDADIVFAPDPGDEARQWAAQWIREHIPGGRFIVVAPGAIYPHKDWPIDRFASVVETILREHPDAHIVVSGTTGDTAKASRLVAIDPRRVFSTCGISSISQSAALFSRCALVVGNDGGAMHLADAMGAKAVSVVPGLEFPGSVEPWHNIDRAIRHPVPCAPCYSFMCCPEGHNRCMMELPVNAVLDQVRRALDEGDAVAVNSG